MKFRVDAKTEYLSAMMRPYASPKHTVVAFELKDGNVSFVKSGLQFSDAPHEDWIFEIASITKVFTAILMCLLIEEGKIDPKAPLSEMSDMLVEVPEWITPERLTSHTSGLPNYYMPMWKAIFQQPTDGPYSTFSRVDLLNWLHEWRGKAPTTSQQDHRYSNLGVGLLGEAMAMMEGKPFIDLMAEKVIRPIGLADTTVQLDVSQQARFAQPKKPNGKPTEPWVFDGLAGAGCLRSSARDLSQFARVVIKSLDVPKTPLHHAICRSVRPITGLGRSGALSPMAQCAGWLRITMDTAAPSHLFHNGGTAGSSCALHICPATEEAFGIFSNNGIAGNLWSSTKLQWSKPFQKAHRFFVAD